MKRILLYGDSVTWGRIPDRAGRYDEQTRYSQVLQNELGTEYAVIEEGLRGRMMAGENPYYHDRDGLTQFGAIFGSQLPIDLLVIYLGTNDTNNKAEKSPAEIVGHLNEYWQVAQQWCNELGMPVPQLLIISPTMVDEAALKGDTKFAGAAKKTRQFPELFKGIADQLEAHFFDAATVAGPSPTDGTHLDPEDNRKLGKALAREIRNIFVQGSSRA